MSLKTNYKNAIPPAEGRHWQMNQNSDGTVCMTDKTQYLQQGDVFGAADVNAITDAVNSCTSRAAGCEASINSLNQSVSGISSRMAQEVTTHGASVYFFVLPSGFTNTNCAVVAAYSGGFQYPFYASAGTSGENIMWVSSALSNGLSFDKIVVQRFA